MMTSFSMRPLTALVLAATLAGCGGGGGGDSPTVGPNAPDNAGTITPVETGPRAAATALLEKWAPVDPPLYTALADVPVSGSASYDGYLYGELANGSDAITDSVIGELTLSVDFDPDDTAFSGSVRDFIDADGGDLTGNLQISGGALDRSGNAADDATIRRVAADGVLTDAQGRALEIGLKLEGDFLGSDHDAIGGEVLGSVTTDGATQDFDGGFIAER